MHFMISISLALLLTGCNSFKLGNLVGTAAVGSVAYATGGAVPAASVVATKIVIDETVQQEVEPTDIDTPEQAVAYAIDSSLMWGVYAFIAFLIITNIVVPFFNQRRLLRRMDYDRKHKED